MRKGSKTARNLMIWVLLLLVLGIICLIVFDVFFGSGKKKPKDPSGGLSDASQLVSMPAEKPAEREDLSDVTVTLADYLVFDMDDLDFRFIIARLHVKADGPTNIPLSHFRTSEGITLDQSEEYAHRLEEKQYYAGRQKVWFSLISEENEYEANVLIPVTGGSATITVSCDFGNNGDLRFSMLPANGRKEMLQYQPLDVITDGKTFQMTVSKAYDITGLPLYQKTAEGEIEYLLPSTTHVYAFEVNAVSLYGDTTVIKDALYVPNNSSETFKALDSSIRSMKYDNMLDQEVREHTTGYLLFYAYDPDISPVTYQGVLRLMLEGSDSWISVNVDLS